MLPESRHLHSTCSRPDVQEMIMQLSCTDIAQISKIVGIEHISEHRSVSKFMSGDRVGGEKKKKS